jgi:hypothetical protein
MVQALAVLSEVQRMVEICDRHWGQAQAADWNRRVGRRFRGRPMRIQRDLRDEAPRILQAAGERDIPAKTVGGLAVFQRCSSARQPPLARDYKDLDLAVLRNAGPELSGLLRELGYHPDEEFNALHGHKRLLFWDREHGRQVDVFVDRMELCHTLDLRDSFDTDEPTLPLADLLLAKLQVVETNEKDFQDAAALLADHDLNESGIEVSRITSVLGGDWGWWRTATETLSKLVAYVEALHGFEQAALVTERAGRLREQIDAAPKSLRWRMRARIGERLTWYELPEEVEG